VAGHKRFRAGAWRLTVEGPPDPITGKRQQVYRTVREPNTRAGAKAADIELSKLVVEVDAQRVLPSSGVTVGQLMERWVAHHRPWLGGTLAGTARRHAGPHPQPPTATTQSPSPVEAVGRRLRSP
jgi:hypothetical protein